MAKQINIREELNKRDIQSCTTDFVNMYESANLSLDKKKELVKLLAENKSNKVISKFFESVEGNQIAQDYIDSKNDNFEKDKEATREVRKELAKQGIATNVDGEPIRETIDKSLEEQIRDAIKNVFKGYDEQEYNDVIGDYLVIDIAPQDGRTKVEVRAELGYNSMDKIADALNPIVQKIDKDAYFDHDTSGVISAYVNKSLKESLEESKLNEWGNQIDEYKISDTELLTMGAEKGRYDTVVYYVEKAYKPSENEDIWNTEFHRIYPNEKLARMAFNRYKSKYSIKKESLKEDIKEQYLVEIQPDTEQEMFGDYAGALDYFNARVSDYKKESRNSDVSVALHKVVDGEIIDTLKHWKKDETLKEEYGYYKDEPYCEEIADSLENGIWVGETNNGTSWELTINGYNSDEFSPSFADYLAQEVAYPVRDGHLAYLGIEMILYKSSMESIFGYDELDKLIPDLIKLDLDRETIDEWLSSSNPDAILDFHYDFNIAFDEDEWEENNREDDSDVYTEMSDEKWESLGKTMTLKDALDLWWNSVRVGDKGYYKSYYEQGYEDLDGNTVDENTLNKTIKLADEYDEDGDGYPIVYAEFVDDSITEDVNAYGTTNTNKEPLKPATFVIEDGQPFEGYDEEYYWNGWECPWFTKEVGDTIIDYYKDYMHFNAEQDAFAYVSPNDDGEIEYFVGQDIETVDGVKHLYPIGNKSWIWDKYTENEDLEEELSEDDNFTYKGLSFTLWYLDGNDEFAIVCDDIEEDYDNTPAAIGFISMDAPESAVMETIKKNYNEFIYTVGKGRHYAEHYTDGLNESVGKLLSNEEFVKAYKEEGFEGAEIILDWDKKQHTFEEWEELLLNTYLDLEQDLLAQGDFETVKHNRDTYINKIIGDKVLSESKPTSKDYDGIEKAVNGVVYSKEGQLDKLLNKVIVEMENLYGPWEWQPGAPDTEEEYKRDIRDQFSQIEYVDEYISEWKGIKEGKTLVDLLTQIRDILDNNLPPKPNYLGDE